LAFIWALSAPTYCYIGEPVVALQRLKRYRDLAPFDPYFCTFEALYVIAYTFKGDYEQAVLVGRGAVKGNPNFSAGYKPLIAALGHLGRADEAKPYIAKLLSLEPHFTVEHFGKTYPFKRASDRRRYMRGLLLAGVPAR
jgi:tetratricopeptide (TPR) repeat protein